ncbi:glucose-6-phosphate dehydrogenase [Buchnera aphidicola]|uniref:Glucose-6-phosphate 1-dehydrogenase n=1 Tax=Buchnera aphidicola (Sarucallis kahawaluokalani) TaxID=1241878 RepID=A0A4D6YLZ7_9GAMM|nr:glucose-6-phosphate dehydrogenase [Buchnera aphidicola]QCI26015.1 glucose-6-phosphate dehydrogenase [Buchnera aphidicola (Sarucallis kahawaluokalani)]
MKINNIQPYDIVIFGAKGDLSCRKLIPALYNLEKKNLLCKNSRIIGIGRANWNQNKYTEIVLKSLNIFYKNTIDINIWNNFKEKLYFYKLDVTQTEKFFNLKNILLTSSNTKIYYFAVPPNKFNNICIGLGTIQYNKPPNKIIVEKPIGTSLQSSKNIHHTLNTYFKEDQIYRIDHYLGKETILNLLTLRFSNPIFYNIWNNKNIEYVKISVSETVGVENRWNYFDEIGQTRDMVQNHLLQILSLITMSIPKQLNSKNIKKKKIQVLKSLRKINTTNIYQNTIRGQYTSGVIDGKIVPAYIEEKGAKKNSDIETFVLIQANIDNEQWFGVPFYLKTGKRLDCKKTEIIIQLKNITHSVFNHHIKNDYQNQIKIRIEPNEGIEINFCNKKPDINSKYKLKNSILKFDYRDIIQDEIPDAYERLLFESMKNDQSLFVSKEEIETSWEWIDSIIHAWQSNKIKVQLYKAGTKGLNLRKNIS